MQVIMSEEKSLFFHRLQQYIITALVGFSTFMLADMWSDFKEHLKEDEETRIMVEKQIVLSALQKDALNVLTGRVETISDRVSK